MNTRQFIALVLFCVCVYSRTNAATVDTALTHSSAMHQDIKAVVVKPADYAAGKRFPVLYLLHGFSGSYSDWIKKVPAIADMADTYHVIIVCPDGNFASWYFDSVENKDFKYETYIASELVSWVDAHYNTINNRSKRAITGLSMGGHGAFFIAFKHQDVFGAAGSMSGLVDLRPFPDSFGIEQVLGKYSEHPERWEQNSIVNMIYLLKSNALALTFDCGYDDFLYHENENLHQKLLERNIAHDFTIRPGTHSWAYWGNSIAYQLLFFNRFFNNILPK